MKCQAPRLLGLGDAHAKIKVYIGNQPSFAFPEKIADFRALSTGEIAAIGNACGNGWRKVFNVYAKWLFTCSNEIYPLAAQFPTWQFFRDNLLLQADSKTALIFETPTVLENNSLNVIMGRTYAKTLPLAEQLYWLNNEFAVSVKHNLVVCPYFDYRQLSNQKIGFLINTIRGSLNVGTFEGI